MVGLASVASGAGGISFSSAVSASASHPEQLDLAAQQRSLGVRHFSFAIRRDIGQQGFLASQHSLAGLASQHFLAGLQHAVGSDSLGSSILGRHNRLAGAQALAGVLQQDLTRHRSWASALFAPNDKAIASMNAKVAPPTAKDRFIEFSKGNEVQKTDGARTTGRR